MKYLCHHAIGQQGVGRWCAGTPRMYKGSAYIQYNISWTQDTVGTYNLSQTSPSWQSSILLCLRSLYRYIGKLTWKCLLSQDK